MPYNALPRLELEPDEDWDNPASYYRKSSSVAPMPASLPEKIGLNEYGELPTRQRLINAAKSLFTDPGDFLDRRIESVWKTHVDVLSDSLDREHNTWNLYKNWQHKENLRKAFHKPGKTRYPTPLKVGKE